MAVKKKKVAPAKKAKPVKKGKLAEIKTKQNSGSVEDFINTVPDEKKRKDSFVLLKMMQKASGEKPKMWGASLIGFGMKRYQSPASGRQVDWFLVGFSPRKANLTVYLMLYGKDRDGLKKLGKHKTNGGCVYINKLEDVDLKVLKGVIEASVKQK